MTSRNRKSLSVKEKICVLKKVDRDQHLKRVDLAKELGLPVSILNTLIYKRWLHKFKLRHGITGKTVSGESGDVACETVDDFIQNHLPDLIKGHEQKDIFNTDETVDVNPIENAESDHFVPPENWSNLSDVTAFEEFVQSDSELATCSLLTIDEVIANEETSNEKEDNFTEKPLPSFQQALAGFNSMQEYLISSDLNDKVKMALLTVHNELFSVHSKKALQREITKYIL
ncbi:hypothetical protein AVEN_12003-1 [Araneus ventricosus]|uniref:Centromere protein CENP-B C-terminal domain-containing protein n=1 Tax=Araneus ventricosus TaxID=182803 RepID=A0A4Y2G4U8_ARAVE|nr:hypothetical protein AVEN_12003-1 [Araneus ventricosus]